MEIKNAFNYSCMQYGRPKNTNSCVKAPGTIIDRAVLQLLPPRWCPSRSNKNNQNKLDTAFLMHKIQIQDLRPSIRPLWYLVWQIRRGGVGCNAWMQLFQLCDSLCCRYEKLKARLLSSPSQRPRLSKTATDSSRWLNW